MAEPNRAMTTREQRALEEIVWCEHTAWLAPADWDTQQCIHAVECAGNPADRLLVGEPEWFRKRPCPSGEFDMWLDRVSADAPKRGAMRRRLIQYAD